MRMLHRKRGKLFPRRDLAFPVSLSRYGEEGDDDGG